MAKKMTDVYGKILYCITYKWYGIPKGLRTIIWFVSSTCFLAGCIYWTVDTLKDVIFRQPSIWFLGNITDQFFKLVGKEPSISNLSVMADTLLSIIIAAGIRIGVSVGFAVKLVWSKDKLSNSIQEKADRLKEELKTANFKIIREQEARELSDARYQNIFKFNGLASFLMDKHTLRIVEVNEKFTQLLGYSPDDVADRSFVPIVHDSQRESVRGIFELYRSQGRSDHAMFELRVYTKKGKTIRVFFSMAPINGSYIHCGFFFLSSTPKFGELMKEIGVPGEVVDAMLAYQRSRAEHDSQYSPVPLYYSQDGKAGAITVNPDEIVCQEETIRMLADYSDGDVAQDDLDYAVECKVKKKE